MADKKNEVLTLLSLDKKRLDQMDEPQLITTMERLDQVKVDAVKDGRFLGKLTRCRECQAEAQAMQRSIRQISQEGHQESPCCRKEQAGRGLRAGDKVLHGPLER